LILDIKDFQGLLKAQSSQLNWAVLLNG